METGSCVEAGTGDGVLVDDECFPVCPAGVTSEDETDFGFAQERSCVIEGSATATGASACEPEPLTDVPEPGDGFYIDETCYPPCASDATDADEEGVTDGFGYEMGNTCIVPDSEPATAALPCIPEQTDMGTGDGFQVGEECFPSCESPDLADEDGWGYEHQRSCVAADSTAALQATACEPLPLEGAPEPGDGYYTTDEDDVGTCNPPCQNPDDADEDGWGYEREVSCIAPGSTAALQALPCIPAESDLSGDCPSPLNCPNVQGEIECGCTWIAGLAERKQVILAAVSSVGGGSADMFLASSMMETETLTTDYTPGDGKSGDAYNLGLTKQNWGMIRQCHAAWSGLGPDDHSSASAMNSDEQLDAQVYKECRDNWGEDWWGGHRAGQIGNTSTDVQRFRAATEWTHDMLQDGHLNDDVRFWVDIPPI